MGGKHSTAVKTRTQYNETHWFEFADLIDHVILLKKVIARPQLTKTGPELASAIASYCYRMARGDMLSSKYQQSLPIEIDWIWHVHRLHPVVYYKDCRKQLGQIVDKQCYNLTEDAISDISITSVSSPQFTPSIDLTKAVLRQKKFLDKFSKHALFLHGTVTKKDFEHLIQNYVSFLKLAREKKLIIPTFDIDIMWRTHKRWPQKYQQATMALCGHLLDHDAVIEDGVLTQVYATTNEKWKKACNSKYGENVDKKYLSKATYSLIFAGGNDGGDTSGGCDG
ncbi:unnamed protein product [Didymodactylos carnosus]|uniref:Uncharacterized protein n=1 Tax=Didymodactylos carnosus TaxID=1234261 RepID=A0A815N0H0_9BILA|nr:unnamed protein product [Didymodactylos carnosus]CAF1457262.1 unnamed protein product [Didymodactylos carnosus]CAF4251154.1 unnamed protein product [Didymodactylos carnosus]CAF4310664.1 unnamed protein product [Didymodactylos carnosus]